VKTENAQVPHLPEKGAKKSGPLCMGESARARTIPYKSTPPRITFGHGNVCAHKRSPTIVGGNM
jgi:hypothetical protein